MKHNLFVNYYTDKHQERSKELDFAFLENLRNPYIDNIVVICTESDYEKVKRIAGYNEIYAVNSRFVKVKGNELSKKLVPVITHIRPTFNNYFKLMNDYFPSEDNINIISNLDIIIPQETLFNPSGKVAKDYMVNKNICLALCRWDAKDMDYKNKNKFLNQVDSQDSWFFIGGVEQLKGADYCLGIAGCDNSIAHILEENGYTALNPSVTLKTFHYHLTEVRNYTTVIGDDIYRIAPPHKTLQPTE